jgi:hypothetical protein
VMPAAFTTGEHTDAQTPQNEAEEVVDLTSSMDDTVSLRPRKDPATVQRDRLYDLLASQGRQHTEALKEVSEKLDKVAAGLNGVKTEISGLKVTPWLITALILAMILSVVGLGVALRQPVQIEGYGVHATTGAKDPAAPSRDAATAELPPVIPEKRR